MRMSANPSECIIMSQGLRQSATSRRTPVLGLDHSIVFLLHSGGFFLLHSFAFFSNDTNGGISCEQTNAVLSVVRLGRARIVDARQCRLPLLLSIMLSCGNNLRVRCLIHNWIGRRHYVVVLREILLPCTPPPAPTRNRISFTMSCLRRSSVSHTRFVAMCGICTFISARI